MRSAADFAERTSSTARLVQVAALAEELETHLWGELDLAAEADNTETIAALLAEYRDLLVPAVVRPWVSERVLVLERIDGVKLGAGHGVPADPATELARTFFRAYVRQVTLEGVYHADPHRGNVLLTGDDRLALLDFGLIGRLDDDAPDARAAADGGRAEPRRRRRRPHPRPLGDVARLRRAGVRPRPPSCAPALPGPPPGGIRAGELAELQRSFWKIVRTPGEL